MKFLAKLSVVVLVVGGILFAAGHAMGGSVYSAWYGGALHPFREALNIGWGDSWHHGWADTAREIADETVQDTLDDVQDTVRDALDSVDDAMGGRARQHHAEHAGIGPSAGSLQNGGTSFTDDHTQNLSFSLGRGDYAIVRGTDDSFSISGTGLDAIQNWVEGDTWCIAYDDAHGARNQERAVTITLPRDFQPESVTLNVGAGSASLCALEAHDASFYVGAGSLTADTLRADEIEVSTGAGYTGVKLAGGWDAYQYAGTAGMGSITVNGSTLAGGLASEISGGSGDRFLELTCGMGEIELTTES